MIGFTKWKMVTVENFYATEFIIEYLTARHQPRVDGNSTNRRSGANGSAAAPYLGGLELDLATEAIGLALLAPGETALGKPPWAVPLAEPGAPLAEPTPGGELALRAEPCIALLFPGLFILLPVHPFVMAMLAFSEYEPVEFAQPCSVESGVTGPFSAWKPNLLPL